MSEEKKNNGQEVEQVAEEWLGEVAGGTLHPIFRCKKCDRLITAKISLANDGYCDACKP